MKQLRSGQRVGDKMYVVMDWLINQAIRNGYYGAKDPRTVRVRPWARRLSLWVYDKLSDLEYAAARRKKGQ